MPCLSASKRITVLMLVTLVVALPLAAQKHHKREVREEIETMEQQWRTAQLAGDTAAMDRLLADDYLGITLSGDIVTKAQQLERMQRRLLVISRMDVSDTKVKLLHGVAIVTSLARLDGSSDGHAMNGSFRSMRVYQRLPTGTWKITSFEATRIPGSHNPHPETSENVPSIPSPEAR